MADLTVSANVDTLMGAANFAAFKASLSLGNVEDTALSTWAGSTNLVNLGADAVDAITEVADAIKTGTTLETKLVTSTSAAKATGNVAAWDVNGNLIDGGFDSTLVDQDVTSGASPTFTGTNITGFGADAIDAITEIADAIKTGNTLETKLVTSTSAAKTTGNVAAWDVNGNLIDGGFDSTLVDQDVTSGAGPSFTSPQLTTPVLGTPTSGTLSNCTGLPTAGLTDDRNTEFIALVLDGADAVITAGMKSNMVRIPYGYDIKDWRIISHADGDRAASLATDGIVTVVLKSSDYTDPWTSNGSHVTMTLDVATNTGIKNTGTAAASVAANDFLYAEVTATTDTLVKLLDISIEIIRT